MIELLAPAGNKEKLMCALHFGADAIYLAGKSYGLRAFADNFDYDGLKEAVSLIHGCGKKMYVTVNIFAHNRDFDGLVDYLKYLDSIGTDGLIVSDPGIISLINKETNLNIHLSTQANMTNKYSAAFWAELGVKRIVLARELALDEIKEIRDYLPPEIELEAFVHGAMCISYSGRCLLSDFTTGRHGNHGECAQSCRWEYVISEKSRNGEYYPIGEDGRGTYILNSKDLNMAPYIKELVGAGIESLKIEGRVKSPYYVAGVVNAYRRAIDEYNRTGDSFVLPPQIERELELLSHRQYCTGFYFGKKGEQCYETSKPEQKGMFAAIVTDSANGGFYVEMRNRFKVGDKLEVISPDSNNGLSVNITEIRDLDGNLVLDANKVQQKLFIKSDITLKPYDVLRLNVE
ncbi:MAG: U32 family peptidase [Clostridiales bacterium]|nr:U32 family peptidase [Clostridiales bacterium]